MRLCALIGLGREPALRGANRTVDVAVAGVDEALQGDSKLEQECVTACRGQRPSRIEDGAELGVGERERRHAANPRRMPRHTRFGVLEQNSGAESQVLRVRRRD
jgi:hypothetical protein